MYVYVCICFPEHGRVEELLLVREGKTAAQMLGLGVGQGFTRQMSCTPSMTLASAGETESLVNPFLLGLVLRC